MKRQIIGLALGLALLGAGSAQALIIDNFDTSQTKLDNGGAVGTISNMVANPAGSMVQGGGDRTMKLVTTTGGFGSNEQVATLMTQGLYNLNAASGEVVTASLEWKTTMGTSVNLLNSCPTPGNTANCFLIFGVPDLDHNISVTVQLTDINGVMDTNTFFKLDMQTTAASTTGLACDPAPGCPDIIGSIFGNPFVGGAGNFGNYYHGLSAFVTPGGPGGTDPATGMSFGGINNGLDFTKITDILFSVTATQGLDFTIDCVYTAGRSTTDTGAAGTRNGGFPVFAPADGNQFACPADVAGVPEPASLLLMGTGLLGVGLVGLRTRSRRRQQA